MKSLVALELQEVPPPHYTEQEDVRKNFWSVLNAVIPTDSFLLLDLELEASLGAHGFCAFTSVLNAARQVQHLPILHREGCSSDRGVFRRDV